MSDFTSQAVWDALFVVLAAFFYAKLEIQIEGAAGWAKNLPTWREKGLPWSLLVGVDKELTGVHFYSFLFLLILLHFPFLFVEWGVGAELRILALFFLIRIVEDFFWFVFNPAYGIGKFNAKNIPWHKAWFLGLPVGYWMTTPLAFLLYYISFKVAG